MARLATAFFFSGFGALLCQVVWQRMLGIFAGSDTVSAALVVGAFLAGLGLGSILGACAANAPTAGPTGSAARRRRRSAFPTWTRPSRAGARRTATASCAWPGSTAPWRSRR